MSEKERNDNFQQELERRIYRMETDPGVLPPHFSPGNYALVAVVAGLCLLGVFLGAWL